MPDLGSLLTTPPASPPLPPPSPVHHLPVIINCSSDGCSPRSEAAAGESNGSLVALDRQLSFPEPARAVAGCNGKCAGSEIVVFRKGRRGSRKAICGKALADQVRIWTEKKVGSGVRERDCSLPFLCNAPKLVECRICRKCIYPDEAVVCSVRDCQISFHGICAKEIVGYSSSTGFKCPQHVCFICKQRAIWRCIRCTIAAHTKCSPWPGDVIPIPGQPTRAICWRHPKDWRLEKEHTVSTSDMEEVFRRLPLPYVDEEFNVDSLLKDFTENQTEPTPYIHIKRNIYLVKKKRDDANVGVGCTNCSNSSNCSEDCECRGQSVSCSKACHCSEFCTNRPFRKEKKIKVVKTRFCGWGVEAQEAINKGDFIIEYIGEVIDDAQCEQRLWDMKYRGDQNFYMCEIRKDFTIDATFKGNASRFLNHSCNPNCKLEKWHVEGETRVGVFASRSIAVGEPITYDYRFEHFGPMVKCNCGAPNCQGYLGSKKKMNKVISCWGCKRRRTAIATVSTVFLTK